MTDTFTLPSSQDKMIPRFYMKPVRQAYRSEQEGREVFEDREYVEIIVPGDKHSIVDVAVKDEHRDRWPRQYEAFQKSQEAPEEGTPIEEWAPIGASQALELKSSHVRTVEHLAGLSDSQLAKVVPMGGHALREKAQAWLKQAEDGKPFAELQQRNRELEERLAAMEAQLKAQLTQEKAA